MREEKLQWFLIKKFIQILLIVSLAAYGITMFINRMVWPIVLDEFFPEHHGTVMLGGTDILFLVILILFLLLIRALQMFLPVGARESMQWLGEQMQGFFSNLFPQLKTDITVFQMDRTDTFFLFLIVLAIAFVVLLPYLIGAGFFARITIREFRKIQEEREAEEREYDRKRNLMLSDIAHDLRTPMTTVNGYAKALADGMVADEDKQQQYLRAIQNKAFRMNNLINLLFEYVKLDSEGFSLDKKELDLCELLRENAALIYSDAESAGMELEIDIPDERIMLMADSIQLSRGVTNLLTNAIRHNDRGTRIGLILEQDLDDVYVLVADSGEMIPDDQAENLFEPFARGDQSRGTGGGSGLGLSIARKVVEMHGWELKLVQQPAVQRYWKAERYSKAFVVCIRCV